MRIPYENDRKGKAWLDVTHIETDKVVKTIETQAYKADRVTGGLLINMSPDYFVQCRYEFPQKGDLGENGKRKR